ncbi:MAG: pyridoxal phosphate-dependent aminotransferase [Promethearchaeota archaeon]
MNLDKIVSENKKRLSHSVHGGEIYNMNPDHHLNQIIDFSTNVNPLINHEISKQTYMNSINHVPLYPDSNSTNLKREIVVYFDNMITTENLIVGAGSMEIISIFCDIFIEIGDEVIIAQPTFSEYEWAVKKKGGNIVNVYRKPNNDFRIECKSILNQINYKTKAIFICNPNNPNGRLDNLSDIQKIINETSKHDVLVLLDEAFIEFTGEDNSLIKKISDFDNLLICRGFSKYFGLTGLRVGYGVSTPEIINLISKGQNLWSVNCVGQMLAQESLKSKEFIENSYIFFKKERKFLLEELRRISGLRIFPTDTNYILINSENIGIKSSEIKKFMLEKNILVRDCSNYEGLDDYYIRIAIKTRKFNLKLIQNLKDCLSPTN